jgi:hypothetical protein
MERLKRLRAAQINKAFQKEALTSAQKRLAEERDRRARETLERSALRRRTPSPDSPRRLHALPSFPCPRDEERDTVLSACGGHPGTPTSLQPSPGARSMPPPLEVQGLTVLPGGGVHAWMCCQ